MDTGSSKSSSLSEWLDLFRWTAAVLVVITHTATRTVTPIAAVPLDDRSTIPLVYTFAAGFAHEAVIVFFVISGYLVGGGLYFHQRKHERLDVAVYATKRLTRLLVVILPTLALVYICNRIAIEKFDALAHGIFYGPSVIDRMSVDHA